jgi:hypothetical protein
MAVQKNFVVKNGIEVNNNLIFADKDSNKVGIATTNPKYSLHVNGGIGATNLILSGVGTIPTIQSTTANINTANISTGIVTSLTSSGATITSLSGTNLNYSGVSTIAVLTSSQIISPNLNISGISTLNNVVLGGYLSIGNTTGKQNQVLVSTGTGVTWSKLSKNSQLVTASSGQNTFLFNYEVGSVEIYINGVRLSPNEFTAIDGATIILNDPCFGNETVEIIGTQTLPVATSDTLVAIGRCEQNLGRVLSYNCLMFL